LVFGSFLVGTLVFGKFLVGKMGLVAIKKLLKFPPNQRVL
jgi:hypothetical protein